MAWVAWLSVALAVLPMLVAWSNLSVFRRPARVPPERTAVSILIPARNEAAAIERAVRGALATVGITVEVRVLDDDSTDETAAIVERIAREDRRLTLLRAPPLDAGWAGKQRACAILASEARHDLLMFVDVDVSLAPDAAAAAASLLCADPRLGMVSGFPRELAVSVSERLVVPWIHVMLLGYLPMSRMRRSTAPAYGAACGQWIVARRAAYVEVGGHASVPLSRHEGTSLPRVFRAHGWKTDVFDGGDLARCRMYDGFATVCRGFAKNPGEGMTTWSALPVWTLLIGLGHVLPAAWLVAGIITGRPDFTIAGVIGSAANILLRATLCVRFGQPWLGAVLHPFGAALMLAIHWYSLLRNAVGRSSEWRGRRYVATRSPGPHAG